MTTARFYEIHVALNGEPVHARVRDSHETVENNAEGFSLTCYTPVGMRAEDSC